MGTRQRESGRAALCAAPEPLDSALQGEVRSRVTHAPAEAAPVPTLTPTPMLSMPLSRRLFARPFSGRRRDARHAALLALGLLAVLFVLAGCDFNDDDRPIRDPDVVVDNGVRVAEFTLGDRDARDDFRFDLTFSTDSTEVQYDTDDVFYPQLASLLTPSAVNDGVVLLYVSDVVDENGLRRDGWTALPLTLGFDEATPNAPEGDGFVDYTLTTTYTYDVRRLYVNLVASDVFTIGFLDRERGLLANLERLTFRLVTIPGGGFNRSINYSDYKALQRAYGLPD